MRGYVPRWKPARSIKDHEEGVAAIEFALLALPFLLLLFAILEIALLVVGSLTVSQATARSARIVQTGQAGSGEMTESQFRARLCDEMLPIIKCEGIHFDLREYDRFASLPKTMPVRDGALDSSGFSYTVGQPDRVMALRVFYEWPLLTAMMHRHFANLNDGKFLFASTVSFRVEPWE